MPSLLKSVDKYCDLQTSLWASGMSEDVCCTQIFCMPILFEGKFTKGNDTKGFVSLPLSSFFLL